MKWGAEKLIIGLNQFKKSNQMKKYQIYLLIYFEGFLIKWRTFQYFLILNKTAVCVQKNRPITET